ncbi:DNA-J related domain-containing protein [Lacimicrobium sp. SS2-24]|uniref:DNA-J related domain-containing protein n=1 Tax=Lacimicrobium sp. SS2-24 TaxID=2005569 RepID=UPI000B4AC388|nr:DNA-J related domain-containing protein [Lacimicrobium sp. SS2-24]
MGQPPDITDILHQLLCEHPQGISEHALITRLQQPEYGVLSEKVNFSDSLSLFQAHFYLFNQLYQLRQQLRAEQLADLAISALSIRLLPYSQGKAGLTDTDSLADYYLDWNQFEKTGTDDVNALLNDFWLRMAGQISEQERTEALSVLELPGNATQAQIRRQYRILIHRHHPDKGGDAAITQQLNNAYRKLM